MALLKRKSKSADGTQEVTVIAPSTASEVVTPAVAEMPVLLTKTTVTEATEPIEMHADAPVPVHTVLPADLHNAEARLQQSDLVNTVSTSAPRKKSPSPALLGGAALGLTGLALGAWYLRGAKQTPVDTSAPIMPIRRTAPPGALAASSAPAKLGALAKPKATTKPGAATRPGARAGDPNRPGGVQQRQQIAAIRRTATVRPGRVGIVPPNRDPRVPEFAPSRPGQVPRMAPVLGSPTPMQPPYAEGIPGRRGGRNEVVLAPRAPSASPTMLKQLWNQGAAAKQRGDKAAARRAWTQMLQMSPGHPGIQDAINKLG